MDDSVFNTSDGMYNCPLLFFCVAPRNPVEREQTMERPRALHSIDNSSIHRTIFDLELDLDLEWLFDDFLNEKFFPFFFLLTPRRLRRTFRL